jgi:catechol 2,3-dioxygenase-like lactoylglutathione lyase family enzyme
MISGIHAVIYSRDAAADRAFFRDVLGLAGVDAGGGWLIFALPPAELALHPAGINDRHELFLLADDVEATIRDLGAKGVVATPIEEHDWGRLTRITLPGGGSLGVYQARHPSPPRG